MRYNNQMNTCEPTSSTAGHSRGICRQARPLLPPGGGILMPIRALIRVVVSCNNFTWALPSDRWGVCGGGGKCLLS